MNRNDIGVFEHEYAKMILQSASYLREDLQKDFMYHKLLDMFEAGLERGKAYDGHGQCCGEN